MNEAIPSANPEHPAWCVERCAELAKKCGAKETPCDGCLSGGTCDGPEKEAEVILKGNET